jgi:hypothetical protein
VESAPVESAAVPTIEPFVADGADPVLQREAAPVADQSSSNLPLWLGVLAALAAAFAGFIAIGRRKSPARLAISVPVLERRVMTPSSALPSAPAAQSSAKVAQPSNPVALQSRSEPAPSLSHRGAAVALPRTLHASAEERDALLKRMVDAQPDQANPFTAKAARKRRARLILASLDRTFEREPVTGLSQESENWPELRRSYATAA